MNNRELCKELGERSGIKPYQVERALKHLGAVLLRECGKGGSVVLGSVGMFYVGKPRPERVYDLKGGPKTSPAHTPIAFRMRGKYRKLT